MHTQHYGCLPIDGQAHILHSKFPRDMLTGRLQPCILRRGCSWDCATLSLYFRYILAAFSLHSRHAVLCFRFILVMSFLQKWIGKESIGPTGSRNFVDLFGRSGHMARGCIWGREKERTGFLWFFERSVFLLQVSATGYRAGCKNK